MKSRIESKLRRLELVWAWGSLLTLIICWDAALRLDQHVSPPRVRIAHADATVGTSQSAKTTFFADGNEATVRKKRFGDFFPMD